MIQERSVGGAIVLVASLLALGCSSAPNDAAPAPASDVQSLPAGHVPISGAAAARSSQAPLLVTVLETMDASGYTYARVDSDGEDAWVAGPVTRLSIGDTLVLSDAMPMQNFTSNSLNRTFEFLYFVGAYQKRGSAVTDGRSVIGGTDGVVRQTLTGGGYAYVQVEVAGDSLWLAGPMVEVSEGQTVTWRGGSMMRGFTSRTLNRTFDEILFVGSIAVVR